MVAHKGSKDPALGRALRGALAAYQLRMDAELTAAGFDERRFPQGRVLRMCAGSAEVTISDVGRQLGISRQAASKIVADLRNRGYLTVTSSAADGREKILTLTPRAVEFLAARKAAARAIEAQLRSQLGVARIDQLVAALDAMSTDQTGQPVAEPGAAAIRALRLLEAEDAT
ncbi:MAG: MarR family transcriptional regulator [Actinobacteria bacterium]|nr:MarR family transcriptional regulator [Actinomycetota bacterium]